MTTTARIRALLARLAARAAHAADDALLNLNRPPDDDHTECLHGRPHNTCRWCT